MTKRYTLIYTDFGDSCDLWATVYGTYETEKEAKQAMEKDIKLYKKSNDCDVTMDRDDVVMLGDEEHGCQWQILEVEV